MGLTAEMGGGGLKVVANDTLSAGLSYRVNGPTLDTETRLRLHLLYSR